MAGRSTPTVVRDEHPAVGRWLILMRATWLVLALTFLGFFVAGLPPRFSELSAVCTDGECVVLALSSAEVDELRGLGLGLAFYSGFHVAIEILSAAVLAGLGLLIFWRRSGDWIGIVVSLSLVAFGLNFMVEADSALARVHPGLVLPLDLLAAVAIVLFVLLFYIFPDGRFVPAWTRVVAAILAVAAITDPLLPTRSQLVPSGQMSTLILIVGMGCLLVGVFAQIYRYGRVSSAIQRQQTKWVVFGLVGLVGPILAWSLLVELFPLEPGIARLMVNLVGFGVMVPFILFFPLSVVISILRYRLWDIDILINRAAVYGLLTVTLAITYFGSVVLLQAAFRAITGQESTIALVVSTLAIAALFQPVRGWIQDFIDIRFYRNRYDAARALAGFADSARDEVDLERLSATLIGVVEQTMQPEYVTFIAERAQRAMKTAKAGGIQGPASS